MKRPVHFIQRQSDTFIYVGLNEVDSNNVYMDTNIQNKGLDQDKNVSCKYVNWRILTQLFWKEFIFRASWLVYADPCTSPDSLLTKITLSVHECGSCRPALSFTQTGFFLAI